MITWIKKQIKTWKGTKEFTRAIEELLNDFDGKRIKNYIEIEMLHPDSGSRYWFTIRRAEGMSVAQKNIQLVDLMSEAVPLAWITHNDIKSAAEWEKKVFEALQ